MFRMCSDTLVRVLLAQVAQSVADPAFEQIDQPALRPLPATPYVFATWKKVRVHIDYHVEIDGEHFYDGGLVNSVPVDRAIEPVLLIQSGLLVLPGKCISVDL